MSVPAPPRVRPVARFADRLGATGSLLCALHCAAVPIVLAVLPGLGLGLLASRGWEEGFVLFATVLAVSSLWLGYRRHRSFRGWMFLVPGLAAVWAAVLYTPLHDSVVPHAVVMTIGGTLIAAAHILNLRLTHSHVQDACCHHHHHGPANEAHGANADHRHGDHA